MITTFFQHSFILHENILPMSCDHNEENMGYMHSETIHLV